MGVTIIYQSLLKIGIGLPTGTPILHLCLQLMKLSFKNVNQDQLKEYEQTLVRTVNISKIINVITGGEIITFAIN